MFDYLSNLIRNINGKNILEIKYLDFNIIIPSDSIQILHECLVAEIYGFKNFLESSSTVIDAGAHIGLFTIYAYSSMSPRRRKIIVSIEPDYFNYLIFKINKTRNQLRNINILRKALWYKTRKIHLLRDEWTAKHKIVEYHTPYSIETITVWDLMKTYGLKNIDFLKMDIEGAETKVLSLNNEWLDNVDVMFLEAHGTNSVKKSIMELKKFGFNISYIRVNRFKQIYNIIKKIKLPINKPPMVIYMSGLFVGVPIKMLYNRPNPQLLMAVKRR